MDKLVVDIDATQKFMYERGVPEGRLQHMHVDIIPFDSPMLDGGNAAARTWSVPWEFDHGEGPWTCFPRIALGVDTRNPDLPLLNYNFRHELGHLPQRQADALYHNQDILQSVRITGAALAIGGLNNVFHPFEHGVGPNAFITGAIATVAGAVVMTKDSYDLAHRLSPQERMANFFSWRNRGFQPVTLAE